MGQGVQLSVTNCEERPTLLGLKFIKKLKKGRGRKAYIVLQLRKDVWENQKKKKEPQVIQEK